MKKIGLLFILLFVLHHSSMAEDSICIRGQLKGNTRFAKVVLRSFGRGIFDIVAVPIVNEKFNISVPTTIPSGVYRLQYSQTSQEYMDVIINGKENEIGFELDLQAVERIPEFKQSDENRRWYDYKKQAGKQIFKIELLHQLMAQYPDTTETLYRMVAKAANNQKRDLKKYSRQFLSQNKHSWAAAMVENTPYFLPNPRDLPQLQDYYRKQNYWKGVNTTQPELINTPLYTEHILNYLKYYMNPGMGFSEQERNDGFKNSVDTIMQKFGGNEQTQKFALKYLQMGFKEIGNEAVLQYIDEKYYRLEEQCDDNASDKEELNKRLASYKAMRVGAQAPEIDIRLSEDRTSSLKTMPHQKVIVAFWASWCPNCEREMPKLEAFVKAHPEYGAVAVSLDDDSVAYASAIKHYPTMIHTCEYLKWQSKAAKDYFIVASPTFIMLDSERKIMGKYPSFDALMEEVKQPEK